MIDNIAAINYYVRRGNQEIGRVSSLTQANPRRFGYLKKVRADIQLW